MFFSVEVGDVFEKSADVLICPANPWLNLSGGVNGEILLRCGEEIQKELHKNLVNLNTSYVEPTSVFVTSAGTLNYENIVHAVAIDAFYDTNQDLVVNTLLAAWESAAELGYEVVMPTLATGYGRLPYEEFFAAMHSALHLATEIDIRLLLILRHEDQRSLYQRQFSKN